MSKHHLLFARTKTDSVRDAVETAIQQSKDGLVRTWDAAHRKIVIDRRRAQRDQPKKEKA